MGRREGPSGIVGVLRGAATQLTAVRSGYRQENVAAVLGPARAQRVVPSLLPVDLPLRMVAAGDVGRVGQGDAVQVERASGEHVDGGPHRRVRAARQLLLRPRFGLGADDLDDVDVGAVGDVSRGHERGAEVEARRPQAVAGVGGLQPERRGAPDVVA